MNAPPTFESFLLHEEEKKLVVHRSISLTSNNMISFYLSRFQNSQGIGHKGKWFDDIVKIFY